VNRRQVLQTIGASLAAPILGCRSNPPTRQAPNFIIVFCDDLGYGDIAPSGGRMIATPHLDRMASEGTVLENFYAAANLCTPSRAGLLTGRYPVRTGLGHQVIMQNDRRGLPQSEVTIAEALKPEYAAALIGKWHLGHVAPFWPPTSQGFDVFFGLPYSHDMEPLSLYEHNGLGVELTREDVDFPQLQQRFYARAERFIEDNHQRPFFLELALSSPHLPNYPHPSHSGHSRAAAYGDVVEEIDDIVGRLLGKLAQLGLERDTLVIFTSDNGPWFEGSSGGLRQRKGGGGYDGGYRVPFIARQPGTVPAGRRVDSIAMSIDLLPTFCVIAGRPLPANVTLDGLDISQVLLHGAASPHDELILFDNEDVMAVRTQRWKYVFGDYYRTFRISTEARGYPQLYDMQADPSESYSMAASHPEVLADMQARFKRATERFAALKTAR
jgi:arylsulfatase A